jgi:hypothetical protein
MQQQAVEATEVPPPDASICDRKGCVEIATLTYMFDWGENGKCCQKHSFVLRQAAEQTQRGVQISPLVAAAPAPLTRDERTRLKAETYALEAEIEDVKARGLTLYNENGKLARQAQAATVRGAETETQLREANVEIERLRAELEKRDADHGNLVDEVGRLRTLSSFTQDTDHSRVDG